MRPLQHRVHRSDQQGWCDWAQYSAVKNNVEKNGVINETIIMCGERGRQVKLSCVMKFIQIQTLGSTTKLSEITAQKMKRR